SGIGISLGDDAVVEAGLYVTAGTKITVHGKVAEVLGVEEGTTVKGSQLSGGSGFVLRRNSVSGAVEAVEWKTAAVALNQDLHKN
ncbi:MAG: 2,3,4,5-tetrahydropyridine-2,6-dicarboxylate N-succinyltransferase, partial [Corynebacterium flavescens]